MAAFLLKSFLSPSLLPPLTLNALPSSPLVPQIPGITSSWVWCGIALGPSALLILRYTTLCGAVLCCAVLCHIVLYDSIVHAVLSSWLLFLCISSYYYYYAHLTHTRHTYSGDNFLTHRYTHPSSTHTFSATNTLHSSPPAIHLTPPHPSTHTRSLPTHPSPHPTYEPHTESRLLHATTRTAPQTGRVWGPGGTFVGVGEDQRTAMSQVMKDTSHHRFPGIKK
jgi:hypothetical protein